MIQHIEIITSQTDESIMENFLSDIIKLGKTYGLLPYHDTVKHNPILLADSITGFHNPQE